MSAYSIPVRWNVALLVAAACLMPISPSFAQSDDADALYEAMRLSSGDWAADVGSGDGDYTLPISRLVGESGRVFAVDIDEDDLEELNDKLKEQDVDNVTSISSVYDNPMLPRRAFEAVLVRNAYHEFTAHESMLAHIHDALKAGGRLVLAEYIDDELAEKDRDAQVDDHNLAMRYARDELRRAGFNIVREEDDLRSSNESNFWMMVAVPDQR